MTTIISQTKPLVEDLAVLVPYAGEVPRRKTSAQLNHEIDDALGSPVVNDRLFIGSYPTGIAYADRSRERHGDYLRVAFLPFRSLELEWERGVKVLSEMRQAILAHAEKITARRGQLYPIDSAGHAVKLGG